MNGTLEYVVFCDWPLSLCVMFSRFICLVTYIKTFLLWPNNILLHEHITFCSFVLRLVGGHLGFYFLALMNCAVMNIHVQVFMLMYVFISFGYIPGSGLPGHLVILCLNFWENDTVFYCTILHTHQQCVSIKFLHILVNTVTVF